MGLLSSLLGELGPVVQYLGQKSTAFLAVTGLIVFCAIATILNVLQQVLFKNPNKPPVVFHIFPFFGSTVVYGMDPYKFFFDCQAKYGDTFTFILLGKKMTTCLGPKGNDMILNGKLTQVSAEEAYTHLTTPVFGTEVVYDCPNHRLMDQKKFMKFGLTSETFRSYVPLMVDEIEDFLRNNPAFKARKGPVDLLKVIPELTIFTASRTLQGKEIRSRFTGEIADLYHDLDTAFTPMNFLFPWFPFPHNKRRDAAQRKMAQIYMDIIKARRAGAQPMEHDMLVHLMDQKYKDGTPVTDKQVAHMMIALLMAGQHTSMTTISWIFLHLASRPDVVQQLLEEQYRVFGKELGPLSYEKLNELTMHNFVVKETLRLHPPLHSIMRKVKSPMHVPNTHYVIPDTHYVLACPGVSAIDGKYFKDPLAYNPMRWAGEDKGDDAEDDKIDFGFGLVSKGTSSPYLPFGAGRHRCIGEQFANVQLGTFICMFVRLFKFELPNGQTEVPPPDYSSMITLPSRPATIIYEWRKPPKN